MKATELQIGDWMKSISPCRVLSISEHRIELYDNTPNYEYEGYKFSIDKKYFNDIKPIPLTAEILEKNEWKRDYDKEWKYNNSHCFPTYRYQWKKERFKIETEANRDGFTILDIIGHRFYYVHELQHALRLCGLNELADNFQI